MYVRRATWLENGPRKPRGLGDVCPSGFSLDPSGAVCVPDSSLLTSTATGCAPNMCFGFPFPWVGSRSKIPAGFAVPGSWQDSAAPDVCYCKPVVDVPAPWGTVITVGLLGLLGLKVVRGVMG